MKDALTSIAEQLELPLVDVQAFATGITNDIIKDGAAEKFIQMSGEDREEMIRAYAVHQVKKMRRFTEIYMTNDQARDSFIASVAALFNK
ncbi:hypothetical protein ValSw41_39 [Vibrio phage ValSw4_1]|nr:hypothetical protein ValSw41_39 [Vibrio phage ValSw4_1]